MQKQVQRGVRQRKLFACLVGVISASSTSLLFATSDTWSGASSSSWADTANWAGGNIPGAVDSATFIAPSSNVAIDLGTGVQAQSLIIDQPTAPSHTFGAGGANGQIFTLSDGGNITVNSGVVADQRFDASVYLGTDSNAANYSITNNSASTLNFYGNIQGSPVRTVNQTKILTFDGSGNVRVNSNFIDGGYSLGLVKIGSGTVTLLGSNIYTGGTTISSGTLQIGEGGTAGGLPGNVVNNGTIIFNRSSNYSYTNSISGTGGIVKRGAGTLTLSGDNLFTGSTVIEAGVLMQAAGATIGNSGNITFKGGTYRYGANSTPIDLSARIHNSTGPISIDILSSGKITFASSIDSSNTGGFEKLGAATLTLSAPNAYTGPTTVRVGVLSIKSINTRPDQFILAGGVLNFDNVNAVVPASTFRFLSGSIRFTAPCVIDSSTQIQGSTSTIVVDTNGQNVACSSVIDSTNIGGFQKTGTGTLTIDSDIQYSGTTTISNGTLILSGNNPAIGPIAIAGGRLLPASLNAIGATSTITFTGGSLAYSSQNLTDYCSRIHNSSAAVGVDTNGNSVTFASSLDNTNTGGLTKSGKGTLYLSASNSYKGVTSIKDGSLCFVTPSALSATSSIAFSGVGFLQYVSTNLTDYSSRFANAIFYPIAIDTNGNSVTFASSQTTANQLLKTGAGTLTLSAVNGNWGSTEINEGTLKLASSNPFANNISLTFSGSGSIQYTSSNTRDYSNYIRNSTGAINIDTNGTNITFGFVLNNTNTGGLTKSGTGSLTLSGSNSYSGTTTISDGTLCLSSLNALGNSNRITFSGTGSPTLLYTSGQVNFAGSIKFSSSTMTIDTGIGTIVLPNPIDSTNSSSLVKKGSGTLTVNGVSEYGGGTTVNTGRLIMGGLPQGKDLTIDASAVLEIQPGGSADKVLSVNLPVLNTSSRIELHDNDMVATYSTGSSTYSTFLSKLRSGLKLLSGSGASGITSVEVDNQTIQGTMLGLVDDGAISGGITATSGYIIPTPSRSVLIKYTWFGDSNLDGQVDGADYALIDSGFTSGGTLKGWVYGDYDYNGTIDAADYALIDTGFISQSGVLPEPVSMGFLLTAAIGLLNRRKRCQ